MEIVPPLTLRRVPSQAMAIATFEMILDSAAALLEEAGFDGFNTNLLSHRSGISTRAIYRYFPNKYALEYKKNKSYVNLRTASSLAGNYRLANAKNYGNPEIIPNRHDID